VSDDVETGREDVERVSIPRTALDEMIATVATLRAVLEPLLDDPFYITAFDRPQRFVCVFCRDIQGHSATHHPDCPVLRRDVLLGRTPPRALDAGVSTALENLD